MSSGPPLSLNRATIAVIGTGPAGLAALKSLLEQGFAATGFDRRPNVGGLWAYASEPSWTSVTRDTVCNISKFVVSKSPGPSKAHLGTRRSRQGQSGFSDFPLPKDCPCYLSGAQVAEYFQTYASHFGLDKHICFGTTVTKITSSKAGPGWHVQVSGPEGYQVHHFDKVVICTGCENVAAWPQMPGKQLYTGDILHGQQYRSPERFCNQRVMVVGMGNTACEVSLSLAERAARVLQAYRRGRITVSRFLDNGIPTDCTVSWPLLRLKYLLDHGVGWLSMPLVDRLMVRKMVSDAARSQPACDAAGKRLSRRERLRRAEHKVKGEWRLTPCPSMAHEHPAVQEHFTAALASGDIVPVRGFKAFVGGKRVLLDDGSVVEVDAIVFCTGYRHDFGIMPELEMDGATNTTPLRTMSQLQNLAPDDAGAEPHLPRLYQMMFPPRHASSVAFISWMAPQENVWCVSELASLALAQIWSAETARLQAATPPPATPTSTRSLWRSKQQAKHHQPRTHRAPSLLPPLAEMNAAVDAYHAWWRREWRREPSVRPGLVRAHTFYRFLHGAAGTGLYERLDHGLSGRGLRLRWEDPELYRWLAKGPINSHAWRLFETNPGGVPGCGRATWAGAREAIREAYEDYQEFTRHAQEQSLSAKAAS
ncbi:hypothetical protein CDD81_6200 [Ophiocordyceps australis]|uniref:FAD/NAD(P)-binding domain-containing protein n=1 Tax=Ophiocordyceps australis TaxID=1399860 RepID=A0A2C5X9K0_9HYPO|nr:hypothetical protein CDD81_6200 [Ophiocordyceps australis]